MTKRTAITISIIAILCGLSFSIYDAHRTANDPTSHILRECGINPVNGAWINAR